MADPLVFVGLFLAIAAPLLGLTYLSYLRRKNRYERRKMVATTAWNLTRAGVRFMEDGDD